jgi:hypothetical protein
MSFIAPAKEPEQTVFDAQSNSVIMVIAVGPFEHPQATQTTGIKLSLKGGDYLKISLESPIDLHRDRVLRLHYELKAGRVRQKKSVKVG